MFASVEFGASVRIEFFRIELPLPVSAGAILK
jgi:hypothetical protein